MIKDNASSSQSEPSALAVVLFKEQEGVLPQEGIVWQSLQTDLASQPLPFELHWALVWRKRELLFSVRWPLDVRGVSAKQGDFLEGLWQGNCAEFFLRHPQGHEYWEFNLSPEGAWWWCAFGQARQRLEQKPQALAGVRASCYQTKQDQVSVLSVPRAHLERWLERGGGASSQQGWRGNVTACVGQVQQFASVAKLTGNEPDFHQPEQFLPLHMA